MTNCIAARAVLLATAVGFAGCGHTSTISTKPEGARVFLNGKQICERTPCAYDGKVRMAHRHHLQIQKSGFRDVDLYVDNELNLPWAALVTATIYLAPFLYDFVHTLDDTLNFELQAIALGPLPGPLPGTAASDPVESGPSYPTPAATPTPAPASVPAPTPPQ